MKSSISPVKGVFFDLYGTLLIYGPTERAWSVWFETLFSCFSKYIPQLSREQLGQLCEGFFSRSEPQVADDGLTVYERRLDQLARQLDHSPVAHPCSGGIQNVMTRAVFTKQASG